MTCTDNHANPTGTKSYRDAPLTSLSSMFAAAAYIEQEWGDNLYALGLAGKVTTSTGYDGSDVVPRDVWQVFCGRDGSRFLIWTTSLGDRGTFTETREIAISRHLNVKSHADRG